MDFFTIKKDLRNKKKIKLDLLVYLIREGGALQEPILGSKYLKKAKDEDFTGEFGESFFTYCFREYQNIEFESILVLGLGSKENIITNSFRKLGAMVFSFSNSKRYEKIGIITQGNFIWEENFYEGFLLSTYRFDKYLAARMKIWIKEIYLFTEKDCFFDVSKALCDAIMCARDLINESPSILNPKSFAMQIKNKSEEIGLKVKLLDRDQIERNGLNLILAVNRGSEYMPYVIRLEYGEAYAGRKKIVLIGKGVTFDTGGLSIKPLDNMVDMKTDMAGAAIVFSVMSVLARVRPNIHVIGYFACVENAIGPKSYRPGDVVYARDGSTIEIVNPDAEGRLILADLIDYAQEKDSPDILIDIATLTGSCIVALGDKIGGVFSNNADLLKFFIKSGNDVGECFAELPLTDTLKDQINSSIADIKNSGGYFGGAITASLFLMHFVKNVSWIHLDIAGPIKSDKDEYYIKQGATGFSIMTLVNFLVDKIFMIGDKVYERRKKI
ncbi:MAG: leucyl aminopeptidase [Deltaproteobacteria bacterium]|nr:MAG: leucyl aminopeptidase [Deltaproteobacteria bacterium]